MQVLMYADKLFESEIVSKNGMKMRNTRLAEFYLRLKQGEEIYCIDTYAMVDGIAMRQGVIKKDGQGNRYLTRVTIVESGVSL